MKTNGINLIHLVNKVEYCESLEVPQNKNNKKKIVCKADKSSTTKKRRKQTRSGEREEQQKRTAMDKTEKERHNNNNPPAMRRRGPYNFQRTAHTHVCYPSIYTYAYIELSVRKTDTI